MSDALDNIFNNIYESEKESKARHEYLANLKSKIAESENELRDTEKTYEGLQKNNEEKMKRLSNREVTLQMLKVRKDLLEERNSELKTEKELLQNELIQLKSKIDSMRKDICVEAEQFNAEYGYSNRHKKSFSQVLYTLGQKEYVKHAAGTSPDIHPNESDSKLESDRPNVEDMNALLFDVDFNCSPLM